MNKSKQVPTYNTRCEQLALDCRGGLGIPSDSYNTSLPLRLSRRIAQQNDRAARAIGNVGVCVSSSEQYRYQYNGRTSEKPCAPDVATRSTSTITFRAGVAHLIFATFTSCATPTRHAAVNARDSMWSPRKTARSTIPRRITFEPPRSVLPSTITATLARSIQYLIECCATQRTATNHYWPLE